MAKTVYGRIVDSDNQPVEFGTVYVSDKNGKVIQPSRNTSTDDNGRFKLDNVEDNDYVTIDYVGLKQKTVNVKDAINIPNPLGDSLPTLLVKMQPDSATNLPEVTVHPIDIPKPITTTKIITTPKPIPTTPKQKPKIAPIVSKPPVIVKSKPIVKPKKDYRGLIIFGVALMLLTTAGIYAHNKLQINK